uniref:Uncharacterized protein n=1 Tax=Rhizophora mucronata TaxID=61149 RepID=A0A2P2M2J6_RHIMU
MARIGLSRPNLGDLEKESIFFFFFGLGISGLAIAVTRDLKRETLAIEPVTKAEKEPRLGKLEGTQNY